MTVRSQSIATFAKAGVLAASVAAFALLNTGAQAQAPSQITLVVPFGAGGTSDISARAIAAKVEQMGGPRVIIENRPGGGGVTAANGVRESQPDGRTLFLANYATFTINRAMAEKFPFDPTEAFKPITTLFSFPLMLVVPTALPAKSVDDLVKLARAKPRAISYGSQGVGTAGHLLGELFATGSKTDLVHVPYKGAAQGVVDLVAGRVDMMFIGVLPTKPHFDKGSLRALAATSKSRLKAVPDAPTMVELGYPDVNTDFVWFGIAAPAGTPDNVVKAIHEAFTKAAAEKDVQEKLDVQGVAVETSTPEQFVARIKADYERFAPIVKASGAKK